MRLFRAILILALNVLASPVWAADFCSVIFAREIPNYFLETNTFETARDIKSYDAVLQLTRGLSVKDILKYLPKNSVYMDSGAGDFFAVVDALMMNPRLEGVGLTYKLPGKAIPDPIGLVSQRLHMVTGEYVEAAYVKGQLDAWKGRVSLLTDVYGPLTYSQNIPALLQIYMNMLKPGGQLMFNLGWQRNYVVEDVHPAYLLPAPRMVNDFLVDGISDPSAFPTWLRSIRGIQVEEVALTESGRSAYWDRGLSFRIVKIDENVVVPDNIRLISYEADTPPLRIFVIDPFMKLLPRNTP